MPSFCTLFTELTLDQIRLEDWQEDNTHFVETKASIEVEKLIKRQNIVIVTGNPGSEKTAIVQHIALKYRSQGWNVKPVDAVNDILEILTKHTLEKKTIFVFNDPIGKETFDEIEFIPWRKHEENLKAGFKKVKLLVSCRIYLLNDNRVKGILKSKSNIIDISSEQLQLSKTEKKDILQLYASNEDISKDELEKIVQTKAYFPLLCKLYFENKTEQKDRLKFFTEPIEVFEEEIRDFRTSCKEKYCSLVLLVLFNNKLCVKDVLDREITRTKFRNGLKLCEMNKNTAPTTINDTLKTLQGYFVKEIGDHFQFYHDFIMEVTTYVFGTDYPKDTIQNADIGFLRKRVRIQNDKSDQFTIYLSEKYILTLGKRLLNDIFGDRLLDVVLNPCLNNENVIQIFIKELERHPQKLDLLLQKKKNQIDSIDLDQMSDNFLLSKLELFSLKERISPLNAIIIFCDANLSLYCLQALQKSTEYLEDDSIFPSICCQGSQEMLEVFLKDNLHAYLSKKWNDLSPIHIAAAFHNFEILTKLLQNGVDVNLKTDNKNFMTPIGLTVGNTNENKEDSQSRRNDTVQVLLDYNADVNLCMGNGASPLYVACQGGLDNTVAILLRNGAKTNLCTEEGASPLYIACELDYGDIVQHLLNNGADINLSLKDGTSPLVVACQKGHDNTVQHLLNYGADINSCMTNGASPLLIACQEGHFSTTKLLLTNGANVNLCTKNKASPLHIACQKGSDSIVQNLLLRGASIDLCMKDGSSPLFVASENGHDNIVQMLISNEANINLCKDNGTNPLHIACQKGHERVVYTLLSNKADTNACMQDGSSPLHIACKYGHTDIVQLLLNNGGNINNCMKNGTSPLFLACQNGHNSIAQLLLNEGADINLCSENGMNPFCIACGMGHDIIVQNLLMHGAKVNLCTKNGTSPLYVACQNGHYNIVQLLLSNNVDINLCKNDETSPLWIACQKGHHNIVELLLTFGANINLCTGNTLSPLHVACQEGHEGIAKLLIDNQ